MLDTGKVRGKALLSVLETDLQRLLIPFISSCDFPNPVAGASSQSPEQVEDAMSATAATPESALPCPAWWRPNPCQKERLNKMDDEL